jgi:hypothetical protein
MSRRIIVGVSTFFVSALIAGVLFAQPEYPVNRSLPMVGACERAIQDKVIANNPRAQKVNFDQASERQSQTSNVETLMKGSGSFTRQSGEVENFTFECAYNMRDNMVIRGDYSVREAELSSKADTSKGWVQTCQNRVEEKIKGEHKEAETVRFATGRESEESTGVKKLAGEGEFVRRNGGPRKFTYECVYNMRDGQITSAGYQPK